MSSISCHPNPAPTDGSILVVGAGPAGLTAAYELIQHQVHPLVVEQSHQVGGIARTENHNGFRFDIGGHRFFTKVNEVNRLWHEVLGDDFITVPRMSRIYYRGHLYNYPLQITNALSNLGFYESVRILLSYLKWQVRPVAKEDSFEGWVVNRFGRRLYNHFFKTYTEKVWGIPCSRIQADWAAQRIKTLSLRKAVINAITKRGNESSLITEFQYPRLGPGMMWERFRQKVEEGGGEVRLETRTQALRRDGNAITHVVLEDKNSAYEILTDHVISSMPLPNLVRQITPAAPPEVLRAADGLNYRDFIIVTLVLDKPDPFPDNWIYIHSPTARVGRIQNFRSWSREMVPNPKQSSIGMEYFCHEGDGLWEMDDSDLIQLGTRELSELQLASSSDVVDGFVIRQPKAYPVYDEHYREHLEVLRAYIDEIDNLQTVGRNGMHRYNNQDHSMLTGILAARNALGASHDLWSVNVERSYHEEFMKSEEQLV